jgi:predicted secreted protein
MNIQTRNLGENQVVISSEDLERLLEIARKIAPVEVEETDFDNRDLMRLAETSGALDFLRDEREDVYTAEDLKVKYK